MDLSFWPLLGDGIILGVGGTIGFSLVKSFQNVVAFLIEAWLD